MVTNIGKDNFLKIMQNMEESRRPRCGRFQEKGLLQMVSMNIM